MLSQIGKIILEQEAPELLDKLNFQTIMPGKDLYEMLFCRIMCAVDTETAVQKVVSHLEKHPGRIGFCPAGGIADQVLAACDPTLLESVVFYDNRKYETQQTHRGYPLYPLKDINQFDTDTLVLLSSAYAQEIFDQVTAIDPGMAEKTMVPFFECTTDFQAGKAIAGDINNTFGNIDREKVIVFVVESFSIIYINRMKEMREKGYKTILISLQGHVSCAFTLDELNGCFDRIVYCENDLLYMLTIVNGLAVGVMHLQPLALHYEISSLAATVASVPVVCEFNDILCTLLDENADGDGYDIPLQYLCEKFLCEKTHGVIYCDHERSYNELQHRYDMSCPAIQFQAYIPETDKVDCDPPQESIGSMVFAGGLADRPGLYGDATCSLCTDIADQLTLQGICLDVYNAYDNGDPRFDHYRQLSEKNPLLTYHTAISRTRIFQTLSRYDYAWLVLNYEHSKVKKEIYKNTMTTKIYDYLTAGLPVIVSEELEYISEFVARWGVGFSMAYKNIHNLKDVLERTDREQLVLNVKRFQEHWELGRQIDRLEGFYHHVCG